ncbi:MAG: T9SS type A sorting domain-containing protein [Flavobacteriales bacterium]
MLLLLVSPMSAQDTLCNAAFTIDNSEPMHVQLDAEWIDSTATYTWTTEGGIIAEGISSNVLLYPGIREICLHVETPTCQADSCIWTDVLCTNNTIKFKLTSYGDSTGIFDTIIIQAFNGLMEVFTYSGLTITTNQHVEWLECVDETIDCMSLVISPQTLWQLHADSINLEAEYISGGAGPIVLQILPNAATSPNFGELLGIDCIWYSVENTESTPLHVWPNPATDVLNFTEAPETIRVLDYSGKLVLDNKGKTTQLSIEQLPSGIYLVQARYGDVWRTARVAK